MDFLCWECRYTNERNKGYDILGVVIALIRVVSKLRTAMRHMDEQGELLSLSIPIIDSRPDDVSRIPVA